MRKLIRHSWDDIKDNRFQHSQCNRRKCEKFHTGEKMIYVDRFGNTWYRLPDCVLPYTLV